MPPMLPPSACARRRPAPPLPLPRRSPAAVAGKARSCLCSGLRPAPVAGKARSSVIAGTDAAAALRAYSLRAPMFYETEVRAYGFCADHDGTAIFGGGAGVGIAVHRIVTPVGTAMTSSWTALRVGTAARLAGASGAPHVRLEVPFLFGAERAIGGITPGAKLGGVGVGGGARPGG